MTFCKTILITLSQLFFVLTYGQEITKPVAKSQELSTHVFNFHCAPSLTQNEPLLIINGTQFKNNTLQRHFFNINDVISVNVISTTNDSVQYFCKRGQNGVIILKTKTPIEWITSKNIARQKLSQFLLFHKKVLFQVDGRNFESSETLYFEKGSIKKITVEKDFIGYYIDKLYKRKITISTTISGG